MPCVPTGKERGTEVMSYSHTSVKESMSWTGNQAIPELVPPPQDPGEKCPGIDGLDPGGNGT